MYCSSMMDPPQINAFFVGSRVDLWKMPTAHGHEFGTESTPPTIGAMSGFTPHPIRQMKWLILYSFLRSYLPTHVREVSSGCVIEGTTDSLQERQDRVASRQLVQVRSVARAFQRAPSCSTLLCHALASSSSARFKDSGSRCRSVPAEAAENKKMVSPTTR